MFVTVLPRADNTYYCSPKLAEQGKTLTFFTVSKRVFTILSGWFPLYHLQPKTSFIMFSQ
jgi:hypothetical protein